MTRTGGIGWLFLVLGTLGSIHPAAGDTKKDPAKRDERLKQELLGMVKEDQEARKEFMKAPSADSPARRMAAIDSKNTERMKAIVDKHGWPGKSLVGTDGAHAAWLLVQHADRDRPFQKRCLKLLGRAVKAGEASGADLAYLTDRVLVADSKKQLYGTQFRLKDGKLVLSTPIEDEANVDRRRKEVGLSTLAEYRKMIEEVYRSQTRKGK